MVGRAQCFALHLDVAVQRLGQGHTFALLMKVLGQPLVVGSGVTLTLGSGLSLQPLLHLLTLEVAGLDCGNGRHVSVMTHGDELQALAFVRKGDTAIVVPYV